MLTFSQAHELLAYRDGVLFWKHGNPRREPGTRAGYARDRGYIEIKIGGRNYRAHRIVFLMFHGYMPELIDHINGDKRDNRIENLRPANKSLNSFSRQASAANSSGVVGVKWKAKDCGWQADIACNGERHYLGFFKDKAKAIEARKSAELRLFGEPHDKLRREDE